MQNDSDKGIVVEKINNKAKNGCKMRHMICGTERSVSYRNEINMEYPHFQYF